MPPQPAARLGDCIICAVPQVSLVPAPHAPPPGLPIMGIGATFVIVGGQPAARMGDFSICVTPVPAPNPILRGAFPVMIMAAAAARMTDQGTHPGSVIAPPCCPSVWIGLAGRSGNPEQGNLACQAAALGRTPPPGAVNAGGAQIPPNTAGQSYNNCGVESSRQIINQANSSNLTQEQMMQQWAAVTTGNPAAPMPAPANLFASGGGVPATRQSLLNNNSVPSSQVAPTPPGGAGPSINAVENQVAQGRGVIADVWASNLWPAANLGTMVAGSNTGGHSILVTGMVYDNNGNITDVIVNDTGIGTCRQVVPVATFNAALIGGGNNFVVTNNPIW